jgi:hypothetical protein
MAFHHAQLGKIVKIESTSTHADVVFIMCATRQRREVPIKDARVSYGRCEVLYA